ncbi:MAG TPA: hypothetical protein VHB27_18595 [Rhodopila sp.]|uniref:hypothetical protein n=1 Tax=Rhodopila sp. TaxID=2480087 RepID=UPI002BD9EFFE|nr:hypothetical protein [Rhodopila sp.]HVY17240.1 hypothetical protein [Rhodopila sp.]
MPYSPDAILHYGMMLRLALLLGLWVFGLGVAVLVRGTRNQIRRAVARHDGAGTMTGLPASLKRQ